VGPSSEAAIPTDSVAPAPTDTTTPAPGDSAAVPPSDSGVTTPPDSTTVPQVDSLILSTTSHPGIPFGAYATKTAQMGNDFNASVRAPGPTNIVSLLTESRGKKARIVVDLISKDGDVKNADGTFSLTKWKAVVARLKAADITSFINDGTVLGVFLLDEPDDYRNWGGETIPPATIEAMAHYSKQLWPTMTTFIRAKPTYLANGPAYVHLDAAWAQYASYHGDFATWFNTQVSAAKSKRLGLMVGLNVLDGGTKDSGIPGSGSGKYAMSASQLRTWGSAMLSQSYPCGFLMWRYDSTYLGRADIASVTRDLAAKARTHLKTSCQQ
jgi:hypothetical protein